MNSSLQWTQKCAVSLCVCVNTGAGAGLQARAQRDWPHKKNYFYFLFFSFGGDIFDKRFRMGATEIWGSAELWVLDVLMGMKWDVRYHSCIPGVGVLGTRAGPGILPNILIEACMNDLAYPVVYWDWHRGICDRDIIKKVI